MEFETVIKVIIEVAAVVAIPIAGYAAIMATRAIWGRQETGPLESELEALKARVGELEANQGRVMEVEERLDFAERVLLQARDGLSDRVDTPPDPHPASR